MSTFLGNSGSNKLIGGSGNDLLSGQGGDDTLLGGYGSDFAWYAGNLADYTFGTEGGYLVVKDKVGTNGDEGTDRLASVEKLGFNNARLTFSSGEFQINTTTAGAQYQSSVTAMKDGGYLVTWTSAEPGNTDYDIYAQRFDVLGNAVGTEFLVTTDVVFSYQVEPVVSVLADGGFVISWTAAPGDVFGRRYDADGEATGDEFQINTYDLNNQVLPDSAARADGGYVIVWASADLDGDGFAVIGQIFDALGAASGEEFLVNTYTANSQYDPAVATFDDESFVVVWESYQQDSSGDGIYAQLFDGSTPLGTEFQVSQTTPGNQANADVTVLAGGSFVVAWDDGDNQDSSIYARIYSSAGVASGDEFLVNTSVGIQVQPTVTALTAGGFVVVWTASQDAGYAILGQRFDAAGNATGDEFRVNSYGPPNMGAPSVSGLDDGGFVVTWTSLGQDGDSTGVYGQRFDANGNAMDQRITGTDGADIINLGSNTLFAVDGANGADVITGGVSADHLIGGSGNDKLTGNDGDDRLDGGRGTDTMIGGNGGDLYVVDATTDLVQESGVGGTDAVESSITYTLGLNLENLQLTGILNINGTGNVSGNLLVGNAGNNKLDGLAGGDLMAGGKGDDTYVVDSLFDLVAENENAGTDRVNSAVDYELGDHLDNLELTGTAINGTGNALDNKLVGNAAANTLIGMAGNDDLTGLAGNDFLSGYEGDDLLSGGLGADSLGGGDGADVFRFDTPLGTTNIDLVLDFESAVDTIQLDQSATLFANANGGYLVGAGTLGAGDFLAATSNSATAVEHILYNTTTGGLYYNADGAGAGVAVLIATLFSAPTLVAGDIEIV